MRSIRLIEGDSIVTATRAGAANGVAAISWAVSDQEDAKLPCGFGRLHEAVCEPKTLDYDEIVLVLEGVFGVQAADGTRVEGKPGDVIELSKGTTVTYFGTNAKIFFVTN